MIRVVYMIELFKGDNLIYRSYVRNKKLAEKYAKRFAGATVRKLAKDEMSFISLDDVVSK